MIDINDTLGLMEAIEALKPPANYLVDSFFPNVEISLQPSVMVEYRKRGHEPLAPYVVEGGRGVNVARALSHFRTYTPPTLAPRRILGQADVMKRYFGEMPVFSSESVEDRAARIQSDDLYDMLGMIQNRKNQQAAELLSTGKITIDGYADDGRLQRIDEISYDWNGEITLTAPWTDANASIMDDLQAMSEKIQEESGVIPSLMVCGRNVPKMLRKNKEMYDWLLIPNRENMAFSSFAPRYLTPQVQYIGEVMALGLTIVSYSETYTDEAGQLRPYIGENEIILGVPGRGKVMHGSISMINDGETGFEQYAATVVPRYVANKESNTMSLTAYSRFVLVPQWVSDWVHCDVSKPEG